MSCHSFFQGTIPTDESLSTPIPLNVRLALQSPEYRLPPNLTRAEELRQIVHQYGFHFVNKRF